MVCLQAKELPTFKDNDFLNEGQKLQIGDENKKYFLEKLKRDVEVLNLLMLSEVLSHWGPHSVRLCTVLEYYQLTLSGTTDGNEVISKLKIKNLFTHCDYVTIYFTIVSNYSSFLYLLRFVVGDLGKRSPTFLFLNKRSLKQNYGQNLDSPITVHKSVLEKWLRKRTWVRKASGSRTTVLEKRSKKLTTLS